MKLRLILTAVTLVFLSAAVYASVAGRTGPAHSADNAKVAPAVAAGGACGSGDAIDAKAPDDGTTSRATCHQHHICLLGVNCCGDGGCPGNSCGKNCGGVCSCGTCCNPGQCF